MLRPRPHGDTTKSANFADLEIDGLGALSHRRPGAAPEIPVRVAIHREVNKLSHNERTKADWPLTRGALFFAIGNPRRTPAFSIPAVNCFKILHFRARHSAPVKQSLITLPIVWCPPRIGLISENLFGTARNVNEVTAAPSAGAWPREKERSVTESALRYCDIQ
jgi:hypothetical protein